jgi:YgiT-type zinc finger domain-containing protein
MKCAVCKQGETAPGHVTVKLERGDSVILVRDVPAEVCADCSEHYLAEDVAADVYALAEEGAKTKGEIEVIRYDE